MKIRKSLNNAVWIVDGWYYVKPSFLHIHPESGHFAINNRCAQCKKYLRKEIKNILLFLES